MSRFQFPWKTRARIAADVQDEFEFHVRARAAELEAEGKGSEEALRLANREFGDRRGAAGFLELFGRVRPGMLPGRAAEELTGLAVDLNRSVQANHDRRFRTVPMTGLDTELRSGVVLVVTLVLSLAGLGLFAAALNAGGLLLARGMSRQKEFALRQALGSGRGRLVRLQVLEAADRPGAGGIGRSGDRRHGPFAGAGCDPG